MGNAPRVAPEAPLPTLKGRRHRAPLQGAKHSLGTVAQGVALGEIAPALSAPEYFDLFLMNLARSRL